MRDTWLSINPHALTHNLATLRQHMPQSHTLAMVKADAYGHGAGQIARLLDGQVEALGVAFLAEAQALRAAGVQTPIKILEGIFTADELALARASGFDLVVHNQTQLALLQEAGSGPALTVWLKINTGMNRLGFLPAEALKVYHQLKNLPVVADIVLITHLACADEPDSSLTRRQLSRFRVLQDTLAKQQGRAIDDSVANSAGILGWPEAHGLWMRPGIALYGSSPFAERSAADLDLLPVMTLHSQVIAVHAVRAGETVGYGASWTAERDTRIAVVAIGYGDGYPRHAPSGTPVLINGERCALAGRVSMDMITVDVGSLSVAEGDDVVLWGAGLSVDEVAQAAGTLSYELFCRLTARVRRVPATNDVVAENLLPLASPVLLAEAPGLISMHISLPQEDLGFQPLVAAVDAPADVAADTAVGETAEPVVVRTKPGPVKQVYQEMWPSHGKGKS